MSSREDSLSLPMSAVLVKSQAIDDDAIPIRGYDFNKGIDYDAIFDSYATTGFQATMMARAIEEINRMIAARNTELSEDVGDCFDYPEGRKRMPCTIFLGFTSNLVSCGLREVRVSDAIEIALLFETLRFLVQHNLVDCLVTSAGGVEEDLIKCLAPSFLGEFDMDGGKLRERGMNRAGNVLIPNDNYCAFEDWLLPILDVCLDEQNKGEQPNWTPSKLIDRLGKEINNDDSICTWAHRNRIPIFCPGLTDGSLGDMLYFHSVKKPGLRLDVIEDVRHINTMAVKSHASGVVILGGGLVKHHINNANLMRNGSDYTVYVNTGQEFDGSDSGARPDEAVSWGKVKTTSRAVKVFADASLVFPVIVARTFARDFHCRSRQIHTDT